MRITAIISILALSTVAAAQHVELGERELEETREFARRDAIADAYADAYASYYKRATVLQARAGCTGARGICVNGVCKVNNVGGGLPGTMSCGACKGKNAVCYGK
ncbi:unnamed protein product [Clonostachys rosea f. rosea IK726]|uniref:Uncharacterized protein n=2 Tax=Clonostachys rosea f. rosea IK726 TaxID=1349383 RepID=A0ACA9UKC3_BIOOC|nr:unnamed protein product [Clonostachys rosea f. rosea IK726]CAG9953504.1 unnamed protein product [Clonostachys rosea f. rosea IK726]